VTDPNDPSNARALLLFWKRVGKVLGASVDTLTGAEKDALAHISMALATGSYSLYTRHVKVVADFLDAKDLLGPWLTGQMWTPEQTARHIAAYEVALVLSPPEDDD
jgi:hypothetical protein